MFDLVSPKKQVVLSISHLGNFEANKLYLKTFTMTSGAVLCGP